MNPDDRDDSEREDPDKTPVRTPSGLLRMGLVPCPQCKRDRRVDCDFCLDDEGRSARYVPVDKAIQWSNKLASLAASDVRHQASATEAEGPSDPANRKK